MDLDDTAAVGHRNFKMVTIDGNAFTASGKMTKRLHDEAANRIHFFIAEAGFEHLIEIFNRR